MKLKIGLNILRKIQMDNLLRTILLKFSNNRKSFPYLMKMLTIFNKMALSNKFMSSNSTFKQHSNSTCQQHTMKMSFRTLMKEPYPL